MRARPERWGHHPEANIILPTGRVFDVLDVPVAAGTAALGLMKQAGVEPGPVAAGHGRMLFFVATRGAPEDEDEWWPCQLDCAPEDVGEVAGLRWHCRNSFVLAPPSRDVTGTAGRWIRPPVVRPARPLPDAVRLLELLADACDESRCVGPGRSAALFGRARSVIPGGVNSPVRAFGSVGGTPCSWAPAAAPT